MDNTLQKHLKYVKRGDLESLKRVIKKTSIAGDEDLFESAIRCGHVKIVKYLAKHSCPRRRDGICLLSAINEGNIDMIRCLTKLGFVWSNHVSIKASNKGNIEILRFMRDNNIKIKYEEVAYSDSVECMKFILDMGYKFTINDLTTACILSNVECVKFIHSYVTEIPDDEAVIVDVYNNIKNLEIFKYVNEVINLEIPHDILYTYICEGLFEIVKYLNDEGLRPARDETFAAIESGNLKMTMYLHERGYPFYNTSDYDKLVVDNEDEEVMKYYHNNIQKSYCYVKACKFCLENKMKALQEMWYMETLEYTDYYQWLPREITEDFTSILC